MTKCKFLKMRNGIKKDGNPYYMVNLLVGDEQLTCFINDVTIYDKIAKINPIFLKDYNAEFEQRIMGGKLVPTLVGLTDIK